MEQICEFCGKGEISRVKFSDIEDAYGRSWDIRIAYCPYCQYVFDCEAD